MKKTGPPYDSVLQQLRIAGDERHEMCYYIKVPVNSKRKTIGTH